MTTHYRPKSVSKSVSKSNRLPEQWFRRSLWLIAVVFAAFLIGLGGKIVNDLPQAEPYQELEHYIDSARATPLRQKSDQLTDRLQKNHQAFEQAELSLNKQRELIQTEQESLENWLKTRSATGQSAHDPEVLKRTHAIDALKAKEQALQQETGRLQQQILETGRLKEQADNEISQLEAEAAERKTADDRRIELTVFLYRLALTLPLLAVAGYLFAKKRQSRWWPFVWGFIYFALFAFFVELVPYLPSYGGYVRYAVGIAVTVLAGRYAIAAMNRYLERKRAEESLPATERSRQMDYDRALSCVAKSICPGCERLLDYARPEMDYCPHCSLRLFDSCSGCQTRKSAFDRFCYRCGTPSQPPEQPSQEAV